MKNIIKIITLSAITIGFSACGGGGGGSSDASFKNAEETINIDVQCVANPDSSNIDNYITLKSQDVIVKDTVNAQISIYHDIDGNKKVC
jgi:hypothetical protein